MISSSTPTVNLRKPLGTLSRLPSKLTTTNRRTAQKSCSTTKIDGKGDAGPGKFELRRDVYARPQTARRQTSVPILPAVGKGKTARGIQNLPIPRPLSPKIDVAPLSPIPSVTPATPFPTTPCPTAKSDLPEGQICEGLLKDPKLKALCVSLGINLSPDTIVGPIEKGRLIIGVLQDTLSDLIKYKMKLALRQGEKFHIQQSGLDYAARALENADRSLKTIKESKQPALGRARFQKSAQSTPEKNQQKTTEAVIRILSNAKDKFDKMDNGAYKLSSSLLCFMSPMSSRYGTAMPKTTTTATSYPASRRTSAMSLTTTAPATPTNTASCSRARTSVSNISIGSRI